MAPTSARRARSALVAVVLCVALLLLLALWQPSVALASPQEDLAPGDYIVKGKTVTVGTKIGEGQNGQAYSATRKGKDVIYKVNKPDEATGAPVQFKKNEIAATRKAGQLIAVDTGKTKMIQKKVGNEGLKDYLKAASNNPVARNAFQQAENPQDNKPKLSDAIFKQVKAQEKKAGYLHGDYHAGNIRVHEQQQPTGTFKAPKVELIDWGTAKKTSKVSSAQKAGMRSVAKALIGAACREHGFAFRGGRQLYRRDGACTRPVDGANEAAGKTSTAVKNAVDTAKGTTARAGAPTVPKGKLAAASAPGKAAAQGKSGAGGKRGK